MKITIYDAITMYKLFCETGVEDFKVYKTGAVWCIGYTCFDEGIEQEIKNAEILIKSSSEEATDDLIIVKQENGHFEVFASEENVTYLANFFNIYMFVEASETEFFKQFIRQFKSDIEDISSSQNMTELEKICSFYAGRASVAIENQLITKYEHEKIKSMIEDERDNLIIFWNKGR